MIYVEKQLVCCQELVNDWSFLIIMIITIDYTELSSYMYQSITNIYVVMTITTELNICIWLCDCSCQASKKCFQIKLILILINTAKNEILVKTDRDWTKTDKTDQDHSKQLPYIPTNSVLSLVGNDVRYTACDWLVLIRACYG